MAQDLPLRLSELKDVSIDEIIGAVRGVLTFTAGVHLRTPEGAEPFTVQSFTLTDGDAKLDGDIYDHQDISQYLGQEIIFASHKAKNGRYGGVKLTGGRKGIFTKGIIRLKVSGNGVLHTPETYAVGHDL